MPALMNVPTLFAGLTPSQKRLIAVVVVIGGVTGAKHLQRLVREAQKEQKRLVSDIEGRSNGSNKSKPSKIGVDRVFFNRLLRILAICVPSPFCREAWLILVQGGLLVSRTLLTDYISEIEGVCGRSLVSQDFPSFGRALLGFALYGIPAAVVNAGLKYMQKDIELAFQERLSSYLHRQYCSNRAYYAASTLGGLTNADQRITEDVEKFAFTISELYSHTFKPLLDVVLFTRSLSRIMGYRNQFSLYAYYVVVAYGLRAISPPLAQMAANEASLSGFFRSAHQRLVTHSEEVAFNDPPAGSAEMLILNGHLRRLVKYCHLSAFQRFLQNIYDGYFVKYFASVTALAAYAAPIYFQDPAARGSQGELTQDYIRSMRLLQNTSRGIGDLIMVYKRINNLASHTSRVAELLEQVKQLSGEDSEHRDLFKRNLSSNAIGEAAVAEMLPPKRIAGEVIAFHRVALDAPDGTPLVRELSFMVEPGSSVMLMGPNGCGKSSLFRVMAGLWPLLAGEITTPAKREVFYLSQRPYLVTGSLRDQLLYPDPPRAVWAGATPKERLHFMSHAARQPRAGDVDAELDRCLVAVELDYLTGRGIGWDQVQSWNETLSGGEKQRLAMARLLFHRPKYAILDECTSAVSADGEIRLYQALQAAGITYLSIGHRPALKKFHSMIIHFDGSVTQTGRGWWVETVTQQDPPLKLAPSS